MMNGTGMHALLLAPSPFRPTPLSSSPPFLLTPLLLTLFLPPHPPLLPAVRYFNADPAEYQVVFTRSATGALKLVGETFPWAPGSTFAYLRENHNSVLGMREYALEAGGHFQVGRWRVGAGSGGGRGRVGWGALPVGGSRGWWGWWGGGGVWQSWWGRVGKVVGGGGRGCLLEP
jgi:hypothetical protein